MKTLRVAIELVGTLGLSALVFWWFGPLMYLAAGGVITVVLGALVLSTHRPARSEDALLDSVTDDAIPKTILIAYVAIGIVLVWAFWPGFPTVLAWRRRTSAGDDDASLGAQDTSRPSDPANQSPGR